jgi:hypothetical protein
VKTGHIEPGKAQFFVMRAAQAQPVLARVDSPGADLGLSVMTRGGTYLQRPVAAQQSWRARLPRTEDYYLGVHGGSAPQDFSLLVQLSSRITFKEGAHSASVRGDTVDGSLVTYSVFGAKDDRMVVSLSDAGGEAVLAVSGFVDGQPYLLATRKKTSVILKLPATQDYIIEVIPDPGRTVGFVLSVEIQE